MKFFNDKRDWFFDAKYGMMVHFGLYTFYEKQEQVLWRYGMNYSEYDKAIPQFNPSSFNPAEWLDLAQANGMRYIVITAKHHDGFCLWDTKCTDYNIMRTPYGKDIIGLLADECHRRKFPLVIYYSVVDWHHPNYPNLGRSHEIKTPVKTHDEKKYMAFVKAQITELCTNYGQIDGIWWDMNVMSKQKNRSFNALIRRLQPTAVINNRGFDEGDFSTPERMFTANSLQPFTTPTEACEAIGIGSWAYRKEEDYIAYGALESHIASYMALGTNFVLGVAPCADGRLSPKSCEYIKTLGDWYRRVGAALRATPVQLKGVDYVMTGDEHTLNVFLLKPLRASTIQLPKLNVNSATLLNDRRTLPLTAEPIGYNKTVRQRPVTRIREIPVNEYANECMVIQLKGDFRKLRSFDKLSKCKSWFGHLSAKNKE